MIKEESIELSSGWTVKEDNHFIGMGVTPTKNKDPNKRQEDVIFIGVRRPNAGKYEFLRFPSMLLQFFVQTI